MNYFVHPQYGTQRHKVFVSYHHAQDQRYRDAFERLFADIHDIMVSKSVQIGDIAPGLKTETIRQKIRDEYLRDTTVTVVLVGRNTWQRKHVDWEIGASIRDTIRNTKTRRTRPEVSIERLFADIHDIMVRNRANRRYCSRS